MNKEIFTTRVQQLTLNVVQTQIDSIRKKDIVKTGIRVYEDAKIGIAGALGRYDENALTQKAIAALELGIPYPYPISSERTETVEPEHSLPEKEAFADEMQHMLAQLGAAQPEFAFSNKITLQTQTVCLANDRGLDLRYTGTSISLSLLIKDKNSANILDAFAGYEGWRYDRTEFLRLCNMVCDAYKRPVELENGTYPVFFIADDFSYLGKMAESLNGLLYGSGGSLFSGKKGEKLFADTVTVYQTRNWQDGITGPFFDVEGTVNEGHRFPLIENGVLVAPMTDKKYAAKFNLDLTGSASGDYDSVPTLGIGNIQVASTGKTMQELLDSRKGILVWVTMGGDFTPDGHFAAPVQLAYLFDGQNLLGRLPELNVSSHLYDMFGQDFIGVSTDSLTTLGKSNLAAMNMRVTRLT